MINGTLELDARLFAALASVPADAWERWFGLGVDPAGARLTQTLVAAFAIPASTGHAAICVFECGHGTATPTLRQAALRRWAGPPPPGAQVLHEERAGNDQVLWTLASAWADAPLRTWLREALSAGASLRADEWEWQATPERPAVSRSTDGSSEQSDGWRHDVVRFPPGAMAVVYRTLTNGAQQELDLLRHLERVPGRRVAPTMLGSAIIRSPDGQTSASAILEDVDPDASSVRSIVVEHLRRWLGGDPTRHAAALDDMRAVGLIARELHAALGRPFDNGVLLGAQAATVGDVEVWVARAWRALTAATLALRTASVADAGRLSPALDLLPGKLERFAEVAKSAPGLTQRTHGELRLGTIMQSPARQLTVVGFDGDPLLPETDRLAPHSPWRDVARLLLSIADAAAEAARLAGGDASAVERAWDWEREARKACLEGYGTGGGEMHALRAIFEVDFAAQSLLDAVSHGKPDDMAVASHTLQRLSRTIV